MPDSPDSPSDSDATIPVSRPQGSLPRQDAPELPLPEELTALLPGGNYRVESFLGQGGMGAVYKGMQIRLKRPVAIKIMRRDQGRDYGFEQRFEREAQAMAKLNHPNIVGVIDYGEAGPDYLYIVMELIDGADLMDVIRTGRMTQEMALTLLPQICDALQFAHDHGIVHRDIKPSNIMLTRDGRVKMADFGLAKRYDAESSFRTQTGTGMGTPDYAAPEQFDGAAQIDHRADIYALGVMIYQMITGQLPRGVWKPPSQRAEVHPKWDEIVGHAMQNDPADRYQAASEIKTDVERVSKLVPPEASRAPSPKPPPTSGGGGTNQEIRSTSRSRAPILLGLITGVVVIAAGAFFVLKPAQSGPLSPLSGSPQTPTAAQGTMRTPTKTILPEDGWQPLVPQAVWEKSVPKRKFADGLLHVTGDYVYAKLPGANPADGAIRSTVKLLPQTRNPSVHARWRGTSGYQLLLQGDIGQMSAQLFFVRDKNSGSIPLGVRKLSTQPRTGDSVTLELLLQGNRLTGRVNGEVCVEATDGERLEAGEWGIYGSDAWFESAEVQPLPAVGFSPSPNLLVSKSSEPKFPPGQWVKLFTKPEDLPADLRDSGVTLENGCLKSSSGNRKSIALPKALSRNYGVRARYSWSGASTFSNRNEIVLRASDSYYQCFLGSSQLQVQHAIGNNFPDLATSPYPGNKKAGSEYDMSFAVIGDLLVARADDALPILVRDDKISSGVGRLVWISSLRDIEVINLDGLPEAEALRLLGVDEKGNDLRGKTGAVSAAEPWDPKVSRAAAEMALTRANSVIIEQNGKTLSIAHSKPLPPGDFRFMGLIMGTFGPAQPYDDLAKSTTAAELKAMLAPVELERIHVKSVRVLDDEICRIIASKPRLKMAGFQGAGMTDALLRHLGQAMLLEDLDLSQCSGVTNAGLAHLSKLPSLRGLGLDDTKVTAQGVVALKSANQLESLSMKWNGDPDAAAVATACPKLKRLALLGNLSTEGLSRIAGLANLTMLRLTKFNLTAAHLATLAGLSSLNELKFEQCLIHDHSALDAAWKKMPKLKQVTVNGAPYSPGLPLSASSPTVSIPGLPDLPPLTIPPGEPGLVKEIPLQGSLIRAVALLPDSRRIMVVRDQWTDLIDLESGASLWTTDGGIALSSDLTPDGSKFVDYRLLTPDGPDFAGGTGEIAHARITLRETASGKVIQSWKVPADRMSNHYGQVAISPSGQTLVARVASTDTQEEKSTRFIALRPGLDQPFAEWNVAGHSGHTTHCLGEDSFLSTGAGAPVFMKPGKPEEKPPVPESFAKAFFGSALSPQKDLLIACENLVVKVWDMTTLQPLFPLQHRVRSEFRHGTFAAKSVALSVDESRQIKVWSTATGSLLTSLPQPRAECIYGSDCTGAINGEFFVATAKPESSATIKDIFYLQIFRLPKHAAVPERAEPLPSQPSARPASSSTLVPSPSVPVSKSSTPASATKDAPFVNSLGMKFVPVPITGGPTDKQRVLFSVWETRVQDYETFVKETKRDWTSEHNLKPDQPAVMMKWEDAAAFCEWITEKDRKSGAISSSNVYRLPSDHEWSCAAGIGGQEAAADLPARKSEMIKTYLWGHSLPPPDGHGNYGMFSGHKTSSRVGAFAPQIHGLHDLTGNVWEWCADRFDEHQKVHVLRGGSWRNEAGKGLFSSIRIRTPDDKGTDDMGFRIVLAKEEGKDATSNAP